MLPEEVLGIPKATDSGETVWTVPEWAVPHRSAPGVVLLDEVDKARPEVLALVLTLLAENRVRDLILHPGTLYVLAGQPISEDWLSGETERALRARVIPIPISYSWEYLERLYGVSLEGFPLNETTVPYLPQPSMRQVQFCLELIAGLSDLDVRNRLIELAIGSAWAERLIAGSSALQAPLMARAYSSDPAAIDRAPLPVVSAVLPYLVTDGSLPAWERAIVRVVGEQPADGAERDMARMYHHVRAHVERYCAEHNGQPCPLFVLSPDATARDWEQAVNRAAFRIAHEKWGVVDEHGNPLTEEQRRAVAAAREAMQRAARAVEDAAASDPE
jgi:hypothetical protein